LATIAQVRRLEEKKISSFIFIQFFDGFVFALDRSRANLLFPQGRSKVGDEIWGKI
jgi:hypothetical protein